MAYQDESLIAASSTEELQSIVAHRQDYTEAAVAAAQSELARRQAAPRAAPTETPIGTAAAAPSRSFELAIGFALPLLLFVALFANRRRLDNTEFFAMVAGASVLVLILGARSWKAARFRAYGLLVWMAVPVALFFLAERLRKWWAARPKRAPREFPKVSGIALIARAIGAYFGSLFLVVALFSSPWLPLFDHHGTGNDASAGLGVVVLFLLAAILGVGVLGVAIACGLIRYLDWRHPSLPFLAAATGLAASGSLFLAGGFRPNAIPLEFDAAIVFVVLAVAAVLAERFTRVAYLLAPSLALLAAAGAALVPILG